METILASILNFVSVSGLCYFASCLKHEKSKLRDVEAAKVFSPSRLLSLLSKPEFLDSLKHNTENSDEYILKTFLEGYVESSMPLQSIIDEKTKLVHSLYYKDDIYSSDSLAQARELALPKHGNYKVRAPLCFDLKDPNKEDSCLVHRNQNVDATSALEKIAETREYKSLNWFERVLVYFGLLLELIGLMTRTAAFLRGIKIGTSEKEFGILIGSALTVYGEIIYDKKEKSLRMDNPKYFLQDKSDIVKKIKHNIYGIQGKMALLFIPFVLTSIYLGKKAMIYMKKIRRKRMEERLDKLWKTKCVKMKDDYKCIVCFDRPRNVIPKPCLHFSLCSVCCNHLEKKNCPVCKKAIADIIEVYIT